jgi:hypothetical protein
VSATILTHTHEIGRGESSAGPGRMRRLPHLPRRNSRLDSRRPPLHILLRAPRRRTAPRVRPTDRHARAHSLQPRGGAWCRARRVDARGRCPLQRAAAGEHAHRNDDTRQPLPPCPATEAPRWASPCRRH